MCARRRLNSFQLASNTEVSMNNNFQELSAESSDQDAALLFSTSMFKVGEFFSKIQQTVPVPAYQALFTALSSRGGLPGVWTDWFGKGVDCEILKPDAKGWKKGKLRIRITVEFCPDEIEEKTEGVATQNSRVESPLDDIRQMTSN